MRSHIDRFSQHLGREPRITKNILLLNCGKYYRYAHVVKPGPYFEGQVERPSKGEVSNFDALFVVRYSKL